MHQIHSVAWRRSVRRPCPAGGGQRHLGGAIGAPKIDCGAVTSAKIADGAVGPAKLADGAVTNAKIADGSVGTAKIGDGSVTVKDLASSISTTRPRQATRSRSGRCGSKAPARWSAT